jgi:hypothetical protein
MTNDERSPNDEGRRLSAAIARQTRLLRAAGFVILSSLGVSSFVIDDRILRSN